MRLAEEQPWDEVPSSVGGLTLEAVAFERVTEVLALGGTDVSAAMRERVGVGEAGRDRDGRRGSRGLVSP